MWYLRWIGIPLAILTWFGIAAAIFVLFWPLGVIAFIGAAMLTEQLLTRYTRAKKAPVGRGE